MKSNNFDFLEYINPARLGGPIFEKELIVSSRRRRNYFVRFAYPAILIFFVASIWTTGRSFQGSSPTIYQVSQMAQTGIYITTAIVWFQFIAVQILAVIMLSTAISDEIYRKTLGVLMTTPISSFQIVFGKLLSRLYQLLLIVAISFPVLAIVRVFGGVPWNYVFSSLCVTLTAAIFAGSLSLLFSIYNRQSQLVVSRILLFYFFIYAVPLIAYQVLTGTQNRFSVLIPELGLFFINPFITMNSLTVIMRSPSAALSAGMWPLHCAVILGLSAAVLLWASYCVRKTGLRQINGQAGLFLTRKERKIADKKQQLSYSTEMVSGKIRDIKWPPVIWREISNSMIKSNRIMTIFSIVLSIAFLATAYGFCIYYKVLGRKETHIVFILVYFFIGLLRTSTFASTSITTEKESRSWPILLTSPLSEKEITYGKIIGSCLRARGYWLLLAAHMVVFTLAGVISVFVIIPLTLIAVSSALLVSAIGVMFSSICKRSSMSSTFNILTFLVLTTPVCCIALPFGSPLFAAFVSFGAWGGYEQIIRSFASNVPSLNDGAIMWLLTQFSFIIYVIVYLLVTYAAYAISANHIRWRIL